MSLPVVRSRLPLRIAGMLLALAGLLALSACSVVSINPLYEDVTPKDPDIVFENNLTGAWNATDGKCVTILTITFKEDIYDLQSAKQGKGCTDLDEKVRQHGRLVKLGNYYFLDISPRPEDVCVMCLAVHQLFLTSLTKDTLALTPIDSDGLKAALAAKTAALSTLPEDPRMLIPERPMTLTALSKDLKDFCRRFAGDKSIFKPESTDVLKRM